MKQFDSESIANRILTSLSLSSEWSQLLGDSAVVGLINAISESEAESVRYMENLLAESKWSYAQNLSSFITQAKYLGYTPQRKISSLGSIYISHDPQLANLGATLFTIDDLQATLSVYSGSDISIGSGTQFSTPYPQVKFLSTRSLTYTSGMQFLEVPVIQGFLSSVSTTVLGNPFEELQISDSSIEDGSNSISENFFQVYMTPTGGSSVLMTRYEDIYLADSNEYAYDIQVPVDLSSTRIRFGNGVAGRLLPSGSSVTVSFLSSLGSKGNVNQNFSINSILTTLPITLYCSNLTPILGGQDADTPDSIQGKAPLAYVSNGGSIISSQAYKSTIESFSYIQTSNVYRGTNPVTNQTTIYYTAITTSGIEAIGSNTTPNTTLLSDLSSALLNKVSPLDTLTYIDPSFIHIRYNLKGAVSSSGTASPLSISASIKESMYSQFGTLQQKFNQVFDSSTLLSYVNQNYSLQRVKTMLEAVQTLTPSNFIKDTLTDFYKHNFYFDPSFKALSSFDSTHQYMLKVNVIFTCAQCLDHNRTIFVVPTTTTAASYNCNIDVPTIMNNMTGNIIFNGTLIPITINTDPTPTTVSVMTDIYSKIITTAPYTGAIYGSTYSGDSPYLFSLSPSSGVLTIFPNPQTNTIGVASISLPMSNALQGVVFNSANTGAYTTLQYPYIPNITDNDYMVNTVLSGTSAPYEIKPGTITDNISTTYIPITVTLDYSSLAPLNLDEIKLGYGSISIPLYLPNSTTLYYINFNEPAIIDANCIIEVVAQPVDSVIYPYSENNIVKIGQTIQNNQVVDDILVEITAT